MQSRLQIAQIRIGQSPERDMPRALPGKMPIHAWAVRAYPERTVIFTIGIDFIAGARVRPARRNNRNSDGQGV